MLPSESDELILRFSFHMFTGNDNFPLRRLFQAGHHIEQRRFSGAGCPDNRAKIAPVYHKVHTVQGPYLRFTDPIDFI